MQLPRGTFREIKKGETIENLIEELERSKFSGICSISSGEGTGTLVYKAGKCILVKFLGKSGDAGCQELQKNRTSEVDAALSSLDDAQIQLSLEFNKACRLVKATKPLESAPSAAPAPEPVKKAPPPPAAHVPHPAPVAPLKAQPKPAAPTSLFHRPPAQPAAPSEQKAVPPAFQRPAMPAPPAPPQPPAKQEETQDAASQGSSFDKDIDTFDTMDLDNVTDKIRNDCKTMIKQLHLEHLMER